MIFKRNKTTQIQKETTTIHIQWKYNEKATNRENTFKTYRYRGKNDNPHRTLSQLGPDTSIKSGGGV